METLFLCFISGIKLCVAPYFNTTTPDPMQAHQTTQILANNKVQILPWLSMSPDLNPNQHARNESERRAGGRVNDSANVCELFQPLKQGWLAIPARVIHNLMQ